MSVFHTQRPSSYIGVKTSNKSFTIHLAQLSKHFIYNIQHLFINVTVQQVYQKFITELITIKHSRKFRSMNTHLLLVYLLTYLSNNDRRLRTNKNPINPIFETRYFIKTNSLL